MYIEFKNQNRTTGQQGAVQRTGHSYESLFISQVTNRKNGKKAMKARLSNRIWNTLLKNGKIYFDKEY